MDDAFDLAVIGAGCIGAAFGMKLAQRTGLNIVILEKESRPGAHQSGRNSGVVHPGFNYEPGSLKAKFATKGSQQLKSYASERDIPYEERGVVVVATTDDEERRLETLARRARQNGVSVELLHDPETIRAIEPHANGRAGLFAPEAASIDSTAYVRALIDDAVDAGVDLRLNTRFKRQKSDGESHVLHTTQGRLRADYVLNTAGVHADRVAEAFDIEIGHKIIPFRGEYYELTAPDLCETMIYPMPDPTFPFLGVHFTRRADGSVIVGPNAVLAFGREAYDTWSVDFHDFLDIFGYVGFRNLLKDRRMLSMAIAELDKSVRKSSFVAAARRLVPDLDPSQLRPGFAGIRAQLVSPEGELVMDPQFVHGPRSSHVLNAVSPGLTSSLAFGDYLVDDVLDRFETR